MRLFQYMLVPFGLSFRFASIDYYFSGITVSIFGLFFVTTVLSFGVFNDIKMVVLKISFLVTVLCLIRSFKLLQQNLEKFYEMYDEILAFDETHTPQTNKFGLSMIIFLLSFMLTYITGMYIVSTNSFINEIFELVNFKVYLYHHFAITSFYFVYWLYVIQFIVFEFLYKYYNVLNFNNKCLERFLCYKPDYLIVYKINDVINKFEENESNLKQIIYPLERTIVTMVLSFNFVMFMEILIYLDHNIDVIFIYMSILFMLFMSFYFVFTQTVIFKQRRVETILMKSIDQWKNAPDNAFIGRIVTK